MLHVGKVTFSSPSLQRLVYSMEGEEARLVYSMEGEEARLVYSMEGGTVRFSN